MGNLGELKMYGGGGRTHGGAGRSSLGFAARTLHW